MSVRLRSLPDAPSFRHLQLEARRRHRAGEFEALNEAQRAIAREHGMASWAALKHGLASMTRAEGQALSRLRSVIERFADAGRPGWVPPGEAELRSYFTETFLEWNPPEELVATVVSMGPDLQAPLVVRSDRPFEARVELAGIAIVAHAERQPPHRLQGVARIPLGKRITDPRVAAAPVRAAASPPPGAIQVAADAVQSLGLPGLLVAGSGPHRSPWGLAVGRADLDHSIELSVEQRFPAAAATEPVTAIAVLRLVAEGRLALDGPANEHLRHLRLADGAVSVRELLSHTAGIDQRVEPFLASRGPRSGPSGPAVSCNGARGTPRPNPVGYAVLGQLLEDVTDRPVEQAVASLVLEPLSMRDSTLAAGPPHGAAGVCGYRVTPEGRFEPIPWRDVGLPAAAGLWATVGDLVRFGMGWSSLLPRSLVREAVRPHGRLPRSAARPPGLGWRVERPSGRLVAGGGVAGISLSLVADLAGPAASVAVTNRQMGIGLLDAAVLDVIAPVGTGRQ